MATKRQGFWKNYSKKVVEMTSSKHRDDPMDAFWCLNKALLDLYKVMDNKGGQREVNRYCGYVLHFVVLFDTIAMKDGDFNLDYSMDDPNLFDPLCKSTLLSVAASLSGIARTFWVEKNLQQRRSGSLRVGEPGLHIQQGDLSYAGAGPDQGPQVP
jgi:hypothetical protein